MSEPVAAVAINGRAAVRREIGGVERVARELVRHLPALRPDRYRVLAPRPALAHGVGQAWEQLALPVLARESELILSPANLAPVASAGSIVMIYDVAPFVGEWYSRSYARWHRLVLPRIARRAKLVLTTSETVRAQISEHLGVDPTRVAVVPLGVDQRFRATVDSGTVGRRFGLDAPYVLAVGTDVARKNLGLLDRIAPQLAREGLQVVFAGSSRPYMVSGGHLGRSLGYVDEADLPGLYAGAAVLAVPSLYEGFGLPCLEAMAAGTPVVSSDRGALPETCGGAAVLVDPDDHAAFAAALLRVGSPGPYRDRLVALGRERAGTYTWPRAAASIDRELEPLLIPR